jgi:hypothetical protein
MSQVTIILGINVQTFGDAVQVDWQFGRMTICLKRTILMALNTYVAYQPLQSFCAQMFLAIHGCL